MGVFSKRRYFALALALTLPGLSLGKFAVAKEESPPSSSGTPPSSPIALQSIEFEGERSFARNSEGKRVELGLDRQLSEYSEKLLKRAHPIAGAAVLLDARNGQVLSAVEIGDQELLLNPKAPAASVFKLVTTAALYEFSSVTPSTRVCTKGGLRSIEREHLVPARGEGTICAPFGQALGVSRNAAYAQLATSHLMREQLLTQAEKLGFNQALLLDAQGSLGTLEVPYNDLEFARTAAGFINSRLSVFGAAQLALTIAHGGKKLNMHFQPQRDASESDSAIVARTAHRTTKAMEVTIHSGTARDSFVKENGRGELGPIQAAGKTGTLRLPEQEATSSWFVGFAPSSSPTVVVSVLLQNPLKWHQKGHQVARDLLMKYFAERGVEGLTPPQL